MTLVCTHDIENENRARETACALSRISLWDVAVQTVHISSVVRKVRSGMLTDLR